MHIAVITMIAAVQSEAGASSTPGSRIAETGEDRKPDDDDPRSEHLPSEDLLTGKEVAERNRPDHGRDEQRLYDRHPTTIERRSLEHNPADLRAQSQKPHPLGQ